MSTSPVIKRRLGVMAVHAIRSSIPERDSFLSLAVRALTLGFKFFLLLYLGSHLDPGSLGHYGLVVTTLSLGTTVLGMEFYVHTMREILGRSRNEKIALIRNQAVLHIGLCFICLPLVYWLDITGRWWPPTGWWLVALLVSEHICQEGYRLLLTISRPISANVIMLLRQGLWALPLIAYHNHSSGPLGLQTVWIFWLGGNATAIGLLLFTARLVDTELLFSQGVDWSYIAHGLKTSIKYVAVFLSFLFSNYCGRYVVASYLDNAAAGIFFFVASVTNIIFTIIETAFLNIVKPRLVELYNRGDEFRTPFLAFARLVLVNSLVVAISICIAVPMLIRYLNRPQYKDHEMLFVILAGSSIGWCASGLFDIALVAYRKDLSVLGAHIAGAAIALAASLLLVPVFGINGAATASLLASWSVASIKAYIALRTMRHAGRDQQSRKPKMAFAE